MMDIGQPDQKRPRIGSGPSQWHNSDNSRQLPPPKFPPPPPQQPFSSRPDSAQNLPSLDRRPSGHSDHPFFDSPDHRRPLSGPSHGYNNHPPHSGPPSQLSPYSGPRDPLPREPMIKRDPSDEPSQPTYGRSPSNHSDHNVNHHPHQPPPQELPGRPYHHVQSMPPPSYDTPHPLQHRNSSYPPQSPMPAPDHYSPHPYPPRPGAPDIYPGLNYPQVGTPRGNETKRKAQRAAQACDSCRTLKAKCDEGRPACSSCKEKGVECRYRDPPPKQQDKGSADVVESIGRLESLLTSVITETRSSLSRIEGRMDASDRFQSTLMRTLRKSDIAPSSNYDVKQESKNELQQPPADINYPRQSGLADSFILQNQTTGYEPSATPTPHDEVMISLAQDYGSEEDEGMEPRQPKEPTIPVNHTTGAARLLKAAGIRELVKDIIGHGRAIRNERYPMNMEEKRGSLRLYGRGEGPDPTPGYERDILLDVASEGTPGDTHSDTSSPAPSGEEWAHIPGLTPPANHLQELARNGMNADGLPDFSRDTVNRLFQSYKVHMNNMHPILSPRQLDTMKENFLKGFSEIPPKPKTYNAAFVGSNSHPDSPGSKLKWSSGVGDTPEHPTFWDHRRTSAQFRSMSSAIVLLILALGKICLHRDRLPDLAPDKEQTANSPLVRNGHPISPMQSSPSMTTLPSPADMHARSRRTSMDGYGLPKAERVRLRNLDVIPGLVYFALATDIIGNQLGGKSLQHVHANILAGLYHGQLGRVLESHSYIYQACYCLEGILRRKFDRFKRLKHDNQQLVSDKDNPYLFAYWTCLQLESDIIAELPVPQSGILTYEDDMPGPNLTEATKEGHDPFIMESYQAQLYMRKHLNLLHNMLYKPGRAPEPEVHQKRKRAHIEDDEEEEGTFIRVLKLIDASINDMKIVAPNMGWDQDAGELSNDILHARLRAKYYGARVITYRHFLLKIMEVGQPMPIGTSALGMENELKAEVGAPPVNQNATSIADIDARAIMYAKKGLQALIHSTEAFHKVAEPGKQRLIVTNIWGTAHAQWGNLVTLQACYKSRILGPLVSEIISEEKLRNLLEKTLAFLKFNATSTNALAVDLFILDHIGKETGLLNRSKQSSVGHPTGPDTNSSFTSAGSGGHEVQMSGF